MNEVDAYISCFPPEVQERLKAIIAFKDKLVEYKTSKGTVQFPLKKPLPIELIREIVKFRVEEQA